MDRTKEIIKVSFIGIIANLFLVVVKGIIGIISGAISIVLDAVNNLSDSISSIITIIGTKLASKAPDKKHPYGHGRIEHITSLVIAVIVVAAGITAFKESIEKIIKPSELNFKIYILIILALTIIVKIVLGLFYIKKAKEYNSDSLKASGKDALFDSIVTLSTLVSAILAYTSGINIEGYVGILISIFIVKAGIEIVKDALNEIIGIRIETDLSKEIKEKVNSFPNVFGSYDLILHSYGPYEKYGSIHIEIPNTLTAEEIDELSRQITYKIYTELKVLLTIGIYSINVTDPLAVEIREYLKEIIKEYPSIIELHGCYINLKNKFMSFDLIFEFSEENKKEIVDNIKEKLSNKYSDFTFQPIIDRDFSD